MSLALAIPVKNDHAALAQLLRQARELQIFDQVLIVDDGSDLPVDVDGGVFGPWQMPVTVLRQTPSAGPGRARNRALEHITTSYMVYLDSDDRFTSEFGGLWRGLAKRVDRDGPFDLCLFRHHDTRQDGQGHWGQMPQDERLWACAGVRGRAPVPVSEAGIAALAETANYPWNKIYRTEFLRAHGLGCAETLVHQDILLHWGALHRARRVLASDIVSVVHRVTDRGGRLTNRRGPERLEVFTVLRQAFAQLAADRTPRDLVLPFLRFSSGLFDWVRSQLDPGLIVRFQLAQRDFLLEVITAPIEAQLIRHDPVLALRMAAQMAEAGLRPAGGPRR